MQTELERYKTLKERLSTEIQNNIRLILTNKSVLENLAIEKACDKFANQYVAQILSTGRYRSHMIFTFHLLLYRFMAASTPSRQKLRITSTAASMRAGKRSCSSSVNGFNT